jgi:two-component SAPR family response regulator
MKKKLFMEVELCMKYIIADPDIQHGIELKKILDGYEILDYQGSYTTYQAEENEWFEHLPDIAFIWLGKAELNASRLASEIKALNPFLKVIFISSNKENAVEAFEYEAEGFLLMPFNEKQIRQILLNNLIDSKK